VGKRGLQHHHVGPGRALLRGVDGDAAIRTEKRIVNVAGENHLDAGQPGIELRDVDRGEAPQCGATARQFSSVAVEQVDAETWSMPAPPSEVALPPTPRISVVQR
jgi:hypothetical protein